MGKLTSGKKQKKGSQNWSIGIDVLCIFTYTLLNYRITDSRAHLQIIHPSSQDAGGSNCKTEKRASKASKPLRHKASHPHLFCQHAPKRNTTHSGGASFWSIFDLRCKSPACGDFYRKAEGNPQRFPSQTPPSSRRTKDSAFVRRKELAADTHARSAFQSEVRQGLCVEPISSMPRAWI